MSYPKSEGTKRPYRLWDANAKKALRWRCYLHSRSAHLGALIDTRWAKVGTTVEVFNADTGRLLGQYTRHEDRISFRGE